MRVEEALSKVPCIGTISNWGRIYQYHLEPSSVAPYLSKLDRMIIDFDLARGPKPGGSTVRLRPPYPPARYILDDLSMARGSYDLRTGALEFQFCQTTPWVKS
jgi:hypothetical protein